MPCRWPCPKLRFHHELPGAVVEPIRDQFLGSCTAFYAVRHFSDVSNARYGVTVCHRGASLVEYGRPRSCPIIGSSYRRRASLKRSWSIRQNSRMYLYLLNNMFDTNIVWDQRGPMSFSYSRSAATMAIGSRARRMSSAGRFIIRCLRRSSAARSTACCPPPDGSFRQHRPGPTWSAPPSSPPRPTGRASSCGLSESRGMATPAVVSLPFFGKITSAQRDRPGGKRSPNAVEVQNGTRIAFTIRPFGVKTVRVVSQPQRGAARGDGANGHAGFRHGSGSGLAVADDGGEERQPLQRLSRQAARLPAEPVEPRGPAGTPAYTDRPQLHYGGWINNRLEPETTYYYRVAAVDRWNNEGRSLRPSPSQRCKSSEKNMRAAAGGVPPGRFTSARWPRTTTSTCCSAPIASRTSSATKSTARPGRVSRPTILIGSAWWMPRRSSRARRSTATRRSTIGCATSITPCTRTTRREPKMTYYYRVCAVDAAGQRGPYSREAVGRTGQRPAVTERSP